MAAPDPPPGLTPIAIPTPFPVGPINVFLHRGDALTLIDTGPRTDEAREALEAGLKAAGVRLGDIERVFLTHHHVDHIGLLRWVREASDAPAHAHPRVLAESGGQEQAESVRKQFYLDVMAEFGAPPEVIEESMALWGAFRGFSEPYVIDHAFEDGGLAGPFRVYFTPGHSSSDTIFVHERDGYSIVGDHILEAINPNPLMRPPQAPGVPRDKSLVQFQESLRRSWLLELGACYPGHGPRFEDHRRVIDGLLRQHDRRNQRVLESIGPEGITVYALARLLYPDLPLVNLYLALSIATGHLELLESRGVLYTRTAAGVTYYFRNGQ